MTVNLDHFLAAIASPAIAADEYLRLAAIDEATGTRRAPGFAREFESCCIVESDFDEYLDACDAFADGRATLATWS